MSTVLCFLIARRDEKGVHPMVSDTPTLNCALYKPRFNIHVVTEEIVLGSIICEKNIDKNFKTLTVMDSYKNN